MESADKQCAATVLPSLELSLRQPMDASVQAQDNTQRLMPLPPPPEQLARFPKHGRSAHRQHRILRPVPTKTSYWRTLENNAQVANYMERQLKDQKDDMIQTSLTLTSSHCQQQAATAAEFEQMKRAQICAIKRQKDLHAFEEAAKREQLKQLEEASHQQALIQAMDDRHVYNVINASFQHENESKPRQITTAWSYKCAQATAKRAAHELSQYQSQPLHPSHQNQPHQPAQNAFATPASVSAPVSDQSNWTKRALPVLNRGTTIGDKMRPLSTQRSESPVIRDGAKETMTVFYENQAQSLCSMLENGKSTEKSPLKKAVCARPPANCLQDPNTPGQLFSELGPVVPRPRPGPTFPYPPQPPSYGGNNMHPPPSPDPSTQLMRAPPDPSTQLMRPVESTTVVTITTTSSPPPPILLSLEGQRAHPLRGSRMGFSSGRYPMVTSTGIQLTEARKASLKRFLSNRKLTQSSKEKIGLGAVKKEVEDRTHSHERTESRPVEPTNATVSATVHSPASGTLSPPLLPESGGPDGSRPASLTRPPPTPPRQYSPQETPPGSPSKRILEREGGEGNLNKPIESGEAQIEDEAPQPTACLSTFATGFVKGVVKVLNELPPSSS